MKRMTIAGFVAAALLMASAGVRAAGPEPVGISLLRIEMKKALLQQDASPKLTALRQKKVDAMKTLNHSAEEVLDAELDLIQAQTAEGMNNVNVKELELQLKEALKAVNAPPAPPAAPVAPRAPVGPGGAAGANQPVAGRDAQEQDEGVATAADIAMLQFDLQKAKLQADGAGKAADNRGKVLAARQAGGTADKVAEAEADVLVMQTNAQLAGLEVEAAQLRLDDAMRSAGGKR